MEWPRQQVKGLRISGRTLRRYSFQKTKRLVSNNRFKTVLARNVRASNGLLTLFIAENDCGYPRLGVSISKSCGNAVMRNRMKRLLREAFRQSQHRIPAGFDYVVMVSARWLEKLSKAADADAAARKTSRAKDARKPTFERVKASFLELAAQASRQVE